MSTVPQPRPAEPTHTDGLEHPAWCVPGLCERQLTDVVHRGIGELFVPTEESNAVELHLEVQRVRRDQVREGMSQVVHAEELQVFSARDGELVASMPAQDVSRFCAMLVAQVWTPV